MRNLGLIAFGITTCVLVPTALHGIEAGPKQVAKLVAPGQRTLTIGKAKVDIAVDRAFADAGDKVHLTLTAHSDAAQRVSLAVLVLESTGTGGGRVELPPDRVGRDEVTFQLHGGTETRRLAFTLPGARARDMEGKAAFGHYTFLVMPPADADKFETLRRRAARVNPMDDEGGRLNAFEAAYHSIEAAPDAEAESDGAEPAPAFGTPGQIARLEVNTRAKDSMVAIAVPDTAQTGRDVAVRVRVRNPSRLAAEGVTVSLSTPPDLLAGGYRGLAEDQVTISETQTVALRGRETKELVFHVTANAPGVLGLFARAECGGDGCYDDPAMARINDSALDAIDIVPAEHAPVVAAQ